jgi:hypothetical protein
MPDLGPMSAAEITTVNQVRWRLSIVDRRWREALELMRQAAAAPDYCGPSIAAIEQIDVALAALRDQVLGWQIAEHQRRAARPRIAPRGQNRSVKRAIAELYGRG